MEIKQPKNSSGLTWKTTFASEKSAMFSKTQQYVDSEVLRYSDPLTPMRTGNLIRSGKLGTKIGSGEVNYLASYSSRMYYGTHYNFSKEKHPQAGAKWFERMKAAHKDAILKGAKKLMGG